jgi:hypothetical protein
MTRKPFVMLAALVGLAVGALAVLAPFALLETKGIAADPVVAVWVREVGVLILVLAIVLVGVRDEPDSRALRAIFVGNALVHLGLFPIEIAAYARGAIPNLGGIVPNSLVHVVLCAGFAYHAARMRP